VLAALRACAEQLHRCNDLDALFDTMLEALQREFAIAHSLFLLFDRSTQKLFAVASHGYENSGVGGEICLGEGVIGVAAQARTPIRIGHTTSEYGYGRAVRAAAVEAGLGDLLETEIPLPGLPESRSQMAVPIIAQQQLLGVLYVESPFDMRFGYDEEDALAVLATQIGNLMLQLQLTPDTEISAIATPIPSPSGAPAEVRYYAQNHGVFLDGDYLIKGVAGAIFWTLAQDYVGNGKRTFSNRQLRLDQRIRLPELSDNLEARLILLSRRLQERSACVRIEKCGRGQFELVVRRPLTLIAANT
jgi:adenylate cyclase